MGKPKQVQWVLHFPEWNWPVLRHSLWMLRRMRVLLSRLRR
jgi:hypothetical protein